MYIKQKTADADEAKSTDKTEDKFEWLWENFCSLGNQEGLAY